MKRIRKAGAGLLATAVAVSTFANAAPMMAQAADPSYSGSLTTVDAVSADGNIVNISFNDGELEGRITFLEDGVFRYNVDPSGEFGEYAEVRSGYPDTAKIQAQPDDSDSYSHPDAAVSEDEDTFTITNEDGDTTIVFDKDTALMTVMTGGKIVMEEAAPLSFTGTGTTQTLVKHDTTNYSSDLQEEYFGGGTQNGRFVHTGEVINISNESSWTDGGVSSPNPFYYTTNGYGVLRNTYMDGEYDFGSANEEVVTATHEENEFDAYIFVSSSVDGSSVTTDLLDGYYTVTGDPVLLPSYAFYLGHFNAYNRDAWSDSEDIGYDWTIKGNDPYDSEGTTTYEEGGTGFEISEGQNAETLNGTGPTVATDEVPDDLTYLYEYSAQAVLNEYLEYDMPIGYFLPNDGYGAGYGQNGYNMTGGVNADGSSSEERLAAVAANVDNLEVFVDYAASLGVATGLWTQSDLTPDSDSSTYWHTLRDFAAEVEAGVTTLKTDVAWVGYGYSFQLSGVKEAYEIITTQEEDSSRPNIISLDGWAGSQRYNSVWTGDQTGGDWEYIRFHIPTFIGQSLSGNPNIGSDMDGIWGGDPVIATRDYQWKSFAPQMLDMDGWGSYAKGPYVHGDPYTGVSRMYLKLKAMMMPYIYTNAYAAVNIDTGNDDTGMPMVRAMFLEFPDESYAYTEAGSQYQYMWGEYLLVAPVYQDTESDDMGNDVRNGIYLPGGEDQIWIDYFTGAQYRGGQVLNGFDAPLWKLPLFVKSGAIIPMYAEHNVVESTDSEGKEIENGLDKTQRIIEFWPDGDTDYSAIEDDGTYIENDTETVDGYGEVDNISYGDHVTTKYTSSVDGTTATLTAEASTGTYEGYESEKDTTFVVNVSEEPTAVTAYNGDDSLTQREVSTKEDFDAAVPAEDEYIYFYDADPEIETFASDEEEILAEMMEDESATVVSDKVYVKFATTDAQANAQTLIIEGYVNNGDLASIELNEDLDAPVLSEAEDLKTPTSITLAWDAVEGATGYEILVDGTIDEGGNVTSGMINSVPGDDLTFTHTDLEYDSEHTYYIRSVNTDGHSVWSEALEARSADDPFRLTPEVTSDQITWTGGIYSTRTADKAFDEEFQSGDEGFHSSENAIGETLTVDYGEAYILDYIEYYPRDDAGNGTVTEMLVETSLDGVNWVKHGDDGSSTDADADLSFVMESSSDTKTLDLSDPNTGSDSIGARYVRFTPLASVGNYFSASELKVYTIESGSGSADSPFRAGNISSVGMSEASLTTFQQMFQKESSQHGSYKNSTWVSEVQSQYGDINFNGIADIWDYAFTAFYVDGGTTKTGSVSGDILLLPSGETIEEGDTFTINVTAIDVENLNGYGSIINYDPDKIEYVSTSYVGTGSMYTQGMTGNIVNDDGTAYINHNAVNMGDQPLVSGSKVLATITLRAKEDITLNNITDVADEDFVIDLSTVTLMGPDFSIKESTQVTEVDIPEVITSGEVTSLIVDAEAKSTGPSGDGDDIWASLDDDETTYTNSNYNDTSVAKPQQYDFTLSSSVMLNKVRICPRITSSGAVGNGAPSSVIVYVSTDGISYTEAASQTIDPASADYTDIEFDAVEAQYVRLVLDSDHETVVATGEVELWAGTSEEITGIEPAESAATQIHVGYVGDVDAVILPEDYPNQYFTATSSDSAIASIITLVDDNGDPVYKVLGMSEGTAQITLTAAADETITCTYDIEVLSGPDKTELGEAISAATGVTESIYTEESYAAYETAYNNAVEVYENPDASRSEVESAAAELLEAYAALVIQPVDESLELDTDRVLSSADALYSESNTADCMFDGDLTTYWESPYSGSDAELPQDVILELADTYMLEQISFTSHTLQNGGVTEYTISVSTDGETWTEVTSGTVDDSEYKQGANVRVDARFAPAEAKYVKFTVEGAVGRISSEDDMYGRIAEMELYGTTAADMTELSGLITEAGSYDQSQYTEDSWNTLSEALAEAEAVLADNSVTTDEVEEAVRNLTEAIAALVEESGSGEDPGTDTPDDEVASDELRAVLQELIDESGGVDDSLYTPATYNAYMSAVERGIEVLSDPEAPKTFVNSAIEEIRNACSALAERASEEELSELESAAENAGVLNGSDYTEESWAEVSDALTDIENALADPDNVSSARVAELIDSLNAAIEGLEKIQGGTSGGGSSTEDSGGTDSSGGEGGTEDDASSSVTPSTGDGSSVIPVLGVIAISGAAAAAANRRRRRSK
ncbi:MAG TPA: discoidin domain-containing protein [Candidatus Mediterraneibacter stercorigallinarum]|uniref:Discoidin domain-containing protein n=1 Tax=Candidatus Mediterraneibacter stercorigallinarum TaxID=2838686 RepID=A0A9D2D966_9FIRM|nr:discoidin domain-containing protein [Candidatus Mediterraneibacter stercorigallinarum]